MLTVVDSCGVSALDRFGDELTLIHFTATALPARHSHYANLCTR